MAFSFSFPLKPRSKTTVRPFVQPSTHRSPAPVPREPNVSRRGAPGIQHWKLGTAPGRNGSADGFPAPAPVCMGFLERFRAFWLMGSLLRTPHPSVYRVFLEPRFSALSLAVFQAFFRARARARETRSAPEKAVSRVLRGFRRFSTQWRREGGQKCVCLGMMRHVFLPGDPRFGGLSSGSNQKILLDLPYQLFFGSGIHRTSTMAI